MGGLRQDGVPRTPAAWSLLEAFERALANRNDAAAREFLRRLPLHLADIEAEASQLPASDALDPEPIDGALLEQAIRNLRRQQLEKGWSGNLTDGWTIADEYNRLRAHAGEPSEPGGGAD